MVSFPATVVRYALFRSTAVGGSVRELESADPDHVLRYGWFAFGADSQAQDGTIYRYWQDPIFINFLNYEWLPESATTGTPPDLGRWALAVRWSLALGCAGVLQLWN
jgi:hypothetical protein